VAVFERTVERRYDGTLNKTAFLNVMTGVVIPRLGKAAPASEEIPRAFKVGHGARPALAADLPAQRVDEGRCAPCQSSFCWFSLRAGPPQVFLDDCRSGDDGTVEVADLEMLLRRHGDKVSGRARPGRLRVLRARPSTAPGAPRRWPPPATLSAHSHRVAAPGAPVAARRDLLRVALARGQAGGRQGRLR